MPRSTPDYFALRVLNTILGGAFTSRLNNNLREVHGYAYGAGSRFDMRLAPGPFYAAAGVQTDKTVRSAEGVLQRADQHPPADPGRRAREGEELPRAAAAAQLRDRRAARPNALAQAYVYDLPADYYATYAGRVRAVTAADVKRAADKYIQPDKFAVVIVGDRKVIEPGDQGAQPRADDGRRRDLQVTATALHEGPRHKAQDWSCARDLC